MKIVMTKMSEPNLISKDGQLVARLVTMLLEYFVINTWTGSTISTSSSVVKCGQVRIYEC
jgi:hypothetical protein